MSASYITSHTFPNVTTTTYHGRHGLKIVKSEPTYMDSLLSDLFNPIGNSIINHFKTTEDKTFKISFVEQLQIVTNSENFQNQASSAARKTGLNSAEQEKCLKKVIEFALKHFADFPSEITRENAQLNFLTYYLHKARVSIKLLWGAITIEPSFSLTKEDFAFLGIPTDYKMSTPQRLDCAGFYFLRRRESRARDWIVAATNKEEHTDYLAFFQRTFEVLKEWGYMHVTEPVENDMVLYLNNGETTHVGLFTAANRVISKLGLVAYSITDHEIHHIPIEFGQQIMFFRKCIQSNHPLHAIRHLELD